MQNTEFTTPLSFRDCSGGMMSGVDDKFIPDNAARLSIGFRYDKVGCATQRNGYARLGAAVASGKTCDGLIGYVNSLGTSYRVVASYNGTDYAYNFSSWTSVGTGGTAGYRVRYADFLDYVFRVGGNQATKSWDGDVSHTFGTTNLTGAPSGTLVLPYKSKLYIAGNASFPDRLYFSTIPTVAGAIAWDTSTQYLDVNPQDGDNLTALMKTGTQMLLFKHDFIYRWNGTATDAEPVINVGTPTQETVANVQGTIIFFHPSGIFSTDGGMPVEISRPVKNFVDAIPAANYAGMCAYAKDDIFGLFCGTVTVDGRTFTNLVLEYDTNNRTWQAHTFADTFRVFANAKDTTGAKFLAGGKTTYVTTMFSGNDDDGTAIPFERQTRFMEFDGLYSEKEINDVVYYLTGAAGAEFSAIPTGTTGIPQTPVKFGATTGAITYDRNKAVRGHSVSFKIAGTNKGTPAVWRGFDITGGRSKGLVVKN